MSIRSAVISHQLSKEKSLVSACASSTEIANTGWPKMPFDDLKVCSPGLVRKDRVTTTVAL